MYGREEEEEERGGEKRGLYGAASLRNGHMHLWEMAKRNDMKLRSSSHAVLPDAFAATAWAVDRIPHDFPS